MKQLITLVLGGTVALFVINTVSHGDFLVWVQESTGIGIFSAEEIAARAQFESFATQFAEGAELNQQVHREAYYLEYCSDDDIVYEEDGEGGFVRVGKTCEDRRAENEQLEAEAAAKYNGAVRERKALAKSLALPWWKSKLLGTTGGTHSTWRVIDESCCYTWEISAGFTPTWE